MLKIQVWGGWGDVLREISLLPVIGLSRWGRCKIRHLPPESAGVRPEAGAPGPDAVRDLLTRCPGLQWAGVGPISRREKALGRICRLLIEPFHAGLFHPGFRWKPEDAISLDQSRRHLVVQTHLAGLPSKRWPVENWKEVLSKIRRDFPALSLHVLDPAGAVLAMDGVTIHDRLSVPQAIRLVSAADAVLSIDSWSKYVAAWQKIPQVILVPDQTSDYAHLTADAVWRYSFRGLQASPEVILLGLKPENTRRAVYTLGKLDNFSIAQIMEVTIPMARKLSLNS